MVLRKIKLRFRNYHDVYIRRASEDCSWIEIQGQLGGIIVYKPRLKRSILKGVELIDSSDLIHGNFLFACRTSGYESNQYTQRHYNRM